MRHIKDVITGIVSYTVATFIAYMVVHSIYPDESVSIFSFISGLIGSMFVYLNDNLF